MYGHLSEENLKEFGFKKPAHKFIAEHIKSLKRRTHVQPIFLTIRPHMKHVRKNALLMTQYLSSEGSGQ